MIDRREFARLFLAGGAGLALPLPLRGAPLRTSGSRPDARLHRTYFAWREVAPGVHAAIGGGGNSMLVIDGGEALLSDAKNLGLGHVLRREAEGFGTPITIAVNTHHHGDHVGGNIALAGDMPLIANPSAQRRIREQAAAFVGSTNDRLSQMIDRMSAEGEDPAVIEDVIADATELEAAYPEAVTPNDTVDVEREVRVGDRTVLLTHVGAGHTDGDVFLHLPELNVIHTGDLLFVGRHGFMDQNGGVDSEGWQRSVRAMIDLCDSETVVISGHGDIVDRSGLERQHAYFDQLRAAVEAAIAEGRSKAEVQELRPDALADITGNPSRNLGVVYDEVTGA